MPKPLEHTTFSPYVNDLFRAKLPQGDVEIELGEVDLHPGGPMGGSTRQPFTLIFLGPKSAMLPEATYALTHADLGTVEIYLIPIISSGERQSYQAIFN
jgi:hypothetical protein